MPRGGAAGDGAAESHGAAASGADLFIGWRFTLMQVQL